MSFGSQSIRSEPSLGAGIFPTAQSVRPIGPFLGSAGGALNQHSITGDGSKQVGCSERSHQEGLMNLVGGVASLGRDALLRPSARCGPRLKICR